MENQTALLKKLKDLVGEAHISTHKADLLPYMRDSYTNLMNREAALPDCVLMPRSTEEIQQIVLLANEYKVPVYPRSFGVNIAGSAIPYQGGIVLDLKAMNQIFEVNEDTLTATIEPGVCWGQLRKAARKKAMDIIPIIGPYQTSPVGNYLLTNITAYSSRYSMDRAVTLEVVLPNGEILRTGSQATEIGAEVNPYFRYSYGPDLTGLFRGSMGNYGIITKMVIRLRPLAEVEKNLYFAFKDLKPALKAIQRIERLEISRTVMLQNKHFTVHCLLSPEDLKDPAAKEEALRSLPDFVLVVGIGGKARQAALYEEMLGEEIRSSGGETLSLPDAFKQSLDEVQEGAGQKILRMFAPFSGYAAVIGCVPITSAENVYRRVQEIVAKFDLKDSITDDPLQHELLVVPYDRCSSVYVEQELLYDPLDIDNMEKVKACLRECYKVIVTEYGAVHTIPNRRLLERVVPGYAAILRGIKTMVDPNGILLPGGPYSI